MKVFFSWSGTESRQIAKVLRNWISIPLHGVEAWISTEIRRGSRWRLELREALREPHYGIICVTPANKDRPWLNYEAGALSHLDIDVSPHLVGLSPGSGPPDSDVGGCRTVAARTARPWSATSVANSDMICTLSPSPPRWTCRHRFAR